MDFEKRFKFIAARVIKKLAKAHVRSDYHVVGLAYQQYVTVGENGARESMTLRGQPVFWTKISVYNPDEQFSKMVIDKYAYD